MLPAGEVEQGQSPKHKTQMKCWMKSDLRWNVELKVACSERSFADRDETGAHKLYGQRRAEEGGPRLD